MERSSSQKGLRIMAILSIIGAVLVIIFGALFGGIGATMLSTADPSDVAQLTAETGMSQQELTGVVGGLGIGTLIGGIVSLICGILCLRAANDNTKIMPAWVIAIISLVANVVSIIMTFANGTFSQNVASSIGGLVFSVLTFYFANNIKAEAGK